MNSKKIALALSTIRVLFELPICGQLGWRPDGDMNSIILGDSAYGLTSWLMPPTVRIQILRERALEAAVDLYQRTHRKTR